jgi:hypothetical protein
MFCKCRLWAEGRDFGGTPDGTRVPDCSVLRRSQLNWIWRNVSCCLWNCLSDWWWLYRHGLMTLGHSWTGVDGVRRTPLRLSIVYWYGIILNRASIEVFLYVVQHKHKREYAHLIIVFINKCFTILKIVFLIYNYFMRCKIVLNRQRYNNAHRIQWWHNPKVAHSELILRLSSEIELHLTVSVRFNWQACGYCPTHLLLFFSNRVLTPNGIFWIVPVLHSVSDILCPNNVFIQSRNSKYLKPDFGTLRLKKG